MVYKWYTKEILPPSVQKNPFSDLRNVEGERPVGLEIGRHGISADQVPHHPQRGVPLGGPGVDSFPNWKVFQCAWCGS